MGTIAILLNANELYYLVIAFNQIYHLLSILYFSLWQERSSDNLDRNELLVISTIKKAP